METPMSIFMSPSTLIWVSIILYLVHLLRRARKFSGESPASYPFIGCLVAFYQNRYRLLAWYTDLLVDSASQTIVLERLGGRRTVVTANPENVEYMLKTNFNNFPKGKPFTEILGDLLGYGIFNVDGELWKSQRKLASHEFSAKSLHHFVDNTLEEEVQGRLLPLLESSAITKRVVDLQEVLKQFAFDIVCRVSLGFDPHCLGSSEVSPLAKAFDVAAMISARRGAAPVALIWKIKRMLGVGSERELKEAIQQVHTLIMEIINTKKNKMKEGDESKDLLSRLILAGSEDEVIRDMAISFVMAGRDTTSAAMTWLFWLLSGHRKIERELVKEIGLATDENLLKACICETMRLYPPVAWDSKHAAEDDFLPDGTPISAGDRVTYFPYGMGRMEAVWGKDRLEFKPDRWFLEPDKEGGELKKVSPFKFPVFQAGPRVCLGKDMAFIQMKYVIRSVLKRFEIKPIGSEDKVFVPLLTAHMAGGLKVLINQREKQY